MTYVGQPLNNDRPSIFLAGPSPRGGNCESWRPEALEILKGLGYEGAAHVPEPGNGYRARSYTGQVNWEYDALHVCDIVVFWVPRSDLLPGFTTNVEFGYWIRSGKILYGRPPQSMRNRYLDWMYEKETGLKPHSDLRSLLTDAVQRVGTMSPSAED